MAMAAPTTKWYFTKEQIMNSPSRKSGIDFDKEMSHRQQAANLIQDIGQTLQVNQLCINTAIVYMHRFYMFHTFAHFHRNTIAACAIFLAAKVEEQPRKLDHVVKVAYRLTNRDQPNLESRSELYNDLANKLVTHENILLQTLGFDAVIDHPHTHVVKCCQLVRATKDMAQTSYFMATNSLHLTTMCLQYSPTIVACVCIHIVTKWSNTQIPPCSAGRNWWYYIDKTVTLETLEALTTEFLDIFNKCPARLKNRIKSGTQGVAGSPFTTTPSGAQPTLPAVATKKPEVPPQRPQVPVDHSAAGGAKDQKERTGQALANHILQRQKPPSLAANLPPQQRQINGTKPPAVLAKPQPAAHPPVPPPQAAQAVQRMRPHPSQGLTQQQQQLPQNVLQAQAKTQPSLPRSKPVIAVAPQPQSQPQSRPEATQQPRPDVHHPRLEKRPEVKPFSRPEQPVPTSRPRPDPGQSMPRSEPVLQTLRPEMPPLDQPHPAMRPDQRPELKHPQQQQPPRPKPRPEQPRPEQRHDPKRMVAVKSEPQMPVIKPPREAPVPPPPLPKSKPPEPPKPPQPQPQLNMFGAANESMPMNPFSSGVLGDYPVGIEHDVMSGSNWDLDFETALGLSPPFGALLGEKDTKPEGKGMPSLFSPEDDSSKRVENPKASVQYQMKAVEENKNLLKQAVQSIQATEVKTEQTVTKRIKEVTNIELREVKKEKPLYSTIDTKEHENLFSTLMTTPATSMFGLVKVEPPLPKKVEQPPTAASLFSPPQRHRTTSSNEPSVVLRKVESDYDALRDGSGSLTLPSLVPEVAEHSEIKTEPFRTTPDELHRKIPESVETLRRLAETIEPPPRKETVEIRREPMETRKEPTEIRKEPTEIRKEPAEIRKEEIRVETRKEAEIRKPSESGDATGKLSESHDKDEKSHKKKKKEKHKKHKHKEAKEGDESRKDRKKHKKDKDKSKEKNREEESLKKLKVKAVEERKSPEKRDIPKLKIKAPRPPSPVRPLSPPKAPEVKIAATEGLKLKFKMNNPVSEVRKRERSPSAVVEHPAKHRKVENGTEKEHEKKKDKKEKHREHKSHKSSKDKERESSSKRLSSDSISSV